MRLGGFFTIAFFALARAADFLDSRDGSSLLATFAIGFLLGNLIILIFHGLLLVIILDG